MPRYDEYGRPMPSANDLLPYNSPEQSQGLGDSVLNAGLSGLGWLSGILEKPRRVAMGALTLNPREALGNLVPYSDALGVTDPAQRTYGHDVLRNLGIGGEDDGFLSAQGLGGFAFDLLTDPLTYTGVLGGANTALGNQAAKLGLTKGMTGAQRAAGFGAGTAEAEVLARGVTGIASGPLTLAQEAQGLGKLGGHIGFGLPFSGASQVAFDLTGLGRGAATAASYLPGAGMASKAYEAVGDPLVRSLRGMFQPEMLGQPDATSQKFVSPRIYAAQQKAVADANEAMLPIIKGYGSQDILADAASNPQALRNLAEGTAQTGSAGAMAARPLADDLLSSVRNRELATGIDTPLRTNYFPRQAVEAEKDVNRLSQGAINPMSTGHPSLVGRESLLEVPGQTSTIEQMVRDPYLIGKTRGAPDQASAAAYIQQKFGVQDPTQAAGLGDWLWGLDASRGEKGFFNRNPLTDLTARVQHGYRAEATAKEAINILADHATDTPMVGGRSLTDVLDKMGLKQDPYAIPGAGPKAHDAAYDALVKAGKVNPAFAGTMAGKQALSAKYVPREIADALERAIKPVQTPELMKAIMGAIENVTNFTKTFLTSPFPAFHIRNAAAGAWQNYVLMGLKDMPEAYSTAAKILRGEEVVGIAKKLGMSGMTDAQAGERFAELAFKHGITGGGISKDVVGQAAAQDLLMAIPGMAPNRQAGLAAIPEFAKGYVGKGQPAIGTAPTIAEKAWPGNIRGVGGRTESTFAPVAAGQRFGTEVEDLGRVAGLYGLMKNGYQPEIAAQMTKAAHVDYSQLTGFETTYMKRLIPFYGWLRGNIPEQIKQVIQSPGGKAATAIKASASASEDGFTPGYLGQGIALPIGQQENGTQRFLSSVGLPFEDLGQLAAGWRGVGGALNPLVKYPIEQMTGQQMYSGRDLADLHSRLGEVAGMNPPNWIENLVMNSPLSRVSTTLGTLADERKNFATKALNLGTGVKLTDVDMPKAKTVALREGIESEMRGGPGVGMFQRMYFRPEDIAQMTPRQAALARLYMDEERRRRQTQQQAR